MKMTCYMNMPSPYQEAFYHELARKCDLRVVYSGSLSGERLALGWESSLAGYDYLFESSVSAKDKLLLSNDSFHFLSGFPGGLLNLLRGAFLSAPHMCATQTEMPTPDDFTPIWKFASRAYVSVIKKKQIVVLGIGGKVRSYFEGIGVPRELVFPFAYFPLVKKERKPYFGGPITYVGQLIKRKRVDVLIRGFAGSTDALGKGLVIVGDGDEKEHLERMTSDLGISNHVVFLGAKKLSEVEDCIAAASCLVLPSGFDGWGVVVNEAISLGVPVIVSDACGASELALHGQCGVVMRSGDVEDLANALQNMAGSKGNWNRMSEMAQQYSDKLSPSSGASYFLSIVEYASRGFQGPRPTAPWMS